MFQEKLWLFAKVRWGGGIRASSDYAQVKRRSVTFLDQNMSRGEAFRLNFFLNHPLSYFEYFNEKKFGLSTEVWVEHFA
jgi:hypothetical protein